MQLTLICCAVLLVLPRPYKSRRQQHVYSGAILLCILSTSVLRSVVPAYLLLLVTLVLCLKHVVSGMSFGILVPLEGLMIGVFVWQCHRIYPFETIHSFPTYIVIGIVVACLAMTFARSHEEAWVIWSYSYLLRGTISVLNGNLTFTGSVSWFWLVELVLNSLYLSKWTAGIVFRGKSRESV